jgi:glycosyltransferase involved in cell wall biosynthesis
MPAGDTREATVSAVIVSCNEGDVIEECLQSVAGWVDEIVVVDMKSTDGTQDIARRYKARLLDHERMGVADLMRQYALSQASSDWILMIDPDERVPEHLAAELKWIANRGDVDVVEIPRQPVQLGRVIRSPGLADMPQARFFRRGAVSWPAELHEPPKLDHLRTCALPQRPETSLYHDCWRTIPRILDLIARYAPLEVDRARDRGRHFSLRAMLRAVGAQIVERMIEGRAYEDGIHGLLIVFYWCVYHATAHAELWESEGRTTEYDSDIGRWGRRISGTYRVLVGIVGVLRFLRLNMRRLTGLFR